MILVTDIKAGLTLTVEKLATFQSNLTGTSVEVSVTFSGETAYAVWNRPNPSQLKITINLPAMPDEARLSRAEADRLTGYVIHEIGHVFHTDLDCFKAQAAIDPFRKQLLNGLEDPRIEDCVILSGQAPGARSCLTVLCQSLLSALPPAFDAGDIRQAPFIIAVLGRAVRWGMPLPAATFRIPESLAPFYRIAMDGLRSAPIGAEGTQHLVCVVDQLMDWLKQREEQQEQPGEQGQPGEQDQTGGQGQLPDPVREQISNEASEAGGGSSEAVPVEPEGAIDRLAKRLTESSKANVLDEVGRAEVRDKAFDQGIDGVFDAYVSQAGGRLGQLTASLGRLLVSPERCGWDTQRQSGRFDVRRSTRALAGSESVFKQRWDKPGLTTDVLLLVDWSGSMKRGHGGGRQAAAARCASVLAAALDRLNGVAFAAYGFSDRRNAAGCHGGDGMTVAMPGSREFQTTPFIAPIKRFDETLRSAKGKLATPRALDNTPDAQCIKLAADILRRRDASRRVMIVLTDGNGDYGSEVTKAAVQYAERAGVEMIGIGIERNVVSSYPTSIVVEDLSDLTGRAMTVLVNRLSAKRVA